MLEQTNPHSGPQSGDHPHAPTHPWQSSQPTPDGGSYTDGAPLSVSAPRAAAVLANGTPGRHADRLGEMIARAELLLLHLESRLHEERSASERAARTTSEVEERLRLGVKMLQALDMQVERGEQATQKAQAIADEAGARLHEATSGVERSIGEHAERAVREKLEWLDRELAWRFDRVKEVEDRIEQAANAKLAWVDEELGKRVAQLEDSCARAEHSLERATGVLEEFRGAAESIQHAERLAERITALGADASVQVETLARATQEASALREAVATIVHDVAASREAVGGELRRMRDDLFWLTDRGERISGELVEQADGAAVAVKALRNQVDAVTPALEELAAWAPLLSGENRERIRPVAEAIAGRVRDALAVDMRGFSLAMRQFADRADQAFVKVRFDAGLLANAPLEANAPEAPLVEIDAKSVAHSLAAELSRLTRGPQSRAQSSDAAAPAPIPAVAAETPRPTANQPLEIPL